MSGIYGALSIGKTAMLTGQKALEITGNNIANVNTPGYSRQIPVFSDIPSVNLGGFMVGRGVTINQIDREYDAFLNKQIQSKNASLGEEEAKSTPLAEIERVFDVSDSGLAAQIDNFFNAWQSLSADPSNQVLRDNVLQSGQQLSQAFAEPVKSLTSLQSDLNVTLTSRVDEINTKLSEVADLNKRISTIETTGQSALSDRDKRDQLLSDLSYSLGTTAIEGDTGMVSLFLPNGVPLVQDQEVMPLALQQSGGNLSLQVQAGSGQPTDITIDQVGGEIHGLLTMRDQVAPGLISDFDTLAYNLAQEVNSAHQSGTGLDGSTGLNFFTPPAQVDGAASSLTVALSDFNQIAAGTSSAPGDNSNALTMTALKDKTIGGLSDTFGGFYSRVAGDFGNEVSRNTLAQQGNQDAMTQLNNLRDSTVGVSLDEEMVNLIKYQRSFEASAKFLSTVNDLMDSMLGLAR